MYQVLSGLFSQFSFKTKCFTLNAKLSLSKGQKGQSSVYIIIFIVVIIFAVMLAGGSSKLFSGNEASPDYSEDISPTDTTSDASSSASWKLVVNQKGCQTNPSGMAIEILPEGGKDGYLAAEIEISPGNFLATAYAGFTPPKQAYTTMLPNARGYNTKNWKIELFEGGTKNGTSYSGGTVRKSFTGYPTSCT